MRPHFILSASLFFVLSLVGCGSSSTAASSPVVPYTPVATFSTTSLSFSVASGSTSTASSVTLTNSGGAALTISGIALGGTNAADFTETNTCGSSLAAGSSCAISATFKPASAATFSAAITVTDNAANSPQTISLTGTGTSSGTPPSGVTRTLYVFPATFPAPSEPDASVTALYTLINSAQSTVDMTMYELQDTTFTADLVADCARGVKVRVILSSSEASANTTDFNAINAGGANCKAVESNSAFTNTHQKTITVDNTTTAILSLNLQTQYYSTTRDFALVENDPADVAAIEATFAEDYAAEGTNSSTDFNYTPGGGDTTLAGYPSGDLIWSPTTAQADMLSLINNAQSTILLENEEMSASNIVSALENACQTRHVTVQIAMVSSTDYTSEFNGLKTAGCSIHLYPDTATGLYIHAKAVVADYGLSTQAVYMGSINYSTASMTENRELGIYITAPTIISTLETTMAADYAGGTPY
jgi:cardiolipin synthase